MGDQAFTDLIRPEAGVFGVSTRRTAQNPQDIKLRGAQAVLPKQGMRLAVEVCDKALQGEVDRVLEVVLGYRFGGGDGFEVGQEASFQMLVVTIVVLTGIVKLED